MQTEEQLEIGTQVAESVSRFCQNCGCALQGEYCRQCGQRERGREIRMADLATDVLAATGKSLFLYFAYGIVVITAGVLYFLANLASM